MVTPVFVCEEVVSPRFIYIVDMELNLSLDNGCDEPLLV